jgi:hypothetical protein
MQAFGAWILNIFLNFVWGKIQALISSLIKKKEQEKKEEQSAEEASHKYEESINKPDVTREEQRAAEDTLLNRKG